MDNEVFTLVKPTTGGLVLLESNGVAPIAKTTPLYLSGKRVGRIRQTIGRVDSPLYVASLEGKTTVKDIAGRKLSTHD